MSGRGLGRQLKRLQQQNLLGPQEPLDLIALDSASDRIRDSTNGNLSDVLFVFTLICWDPKALLYQHDSMDRVGKFLGRRLCAELDNRFASTVHQSSLSYQWCQLRKIAKYCFHADSVNTDRPTSSSSSSHEMARGVGKLEKKHPQTQDAKPHIRLPGTMPLTLRHHMPTTPYSGHLATSHERDAT